MQCNVCSVMFKWNECKEDNVENVMWWMQHIECSGILFTEWNVTIQMWIQCNNANSNECDATMN